MKLDKNIEDIFSVIYNCFGNEYEPFHIIDAEDRADKRISFLPFRDIIEFESYHSLNLEEQKNFISTSGIIFIYNTVGKNVESLKTLGLYRCYHEDFIQEIGFSTEKSILLYVILHEIGHWKHFCEMGKKVYDYSSLKEQFLEAKANQFADKCLNILYPDMK